jgi:signal transduction histidine kinase
VAATAPDKSSWAEVVQAGLATVSAIAFLLGLAPPASLRLLWRQAETERIQGAIMRLMGATTEDEVASEVLEPMARMVGARGIALRAVDGRLIGSYGAPAETLDVPEESQRGGEVVRLEVPAGSLAVRTSPYAPYFGREELALLRTLGALTGLALDRTRLFAEERDMRAALERTNEVMANFVALASHELRTPVTALRTNAELLREDPGGDHAAVLDDVVEQTEELSALVTDLIELARGDQPGDELQDVRLDALVAEALERARRHAPGVEFAADLEPAAVDGVPERLGRAVNNLLDNAAKFSPEGEPVEVTLRDGALTVRDHGPGVPAADLPHIFDRFYRAGNAREQAGSGLGLAIVRQVAERHGGSVAAAAADGGGLAVTLTLPGARPIEPA